MLWSAYVRQCFGIMLGAESTVLGALVLSNGRAHNVECTHTPTHSEQVFGIYCSAAHTQSHTFHSQTHTHTHTTTHTHPPSPVMLVRVVANAFKSHAERVCFRALFLAHLCDACTRARARPPECTHQIEAPQCACKCRATPPPPASQPGAQVPAGVEVFNKQSAQWICAESRDWTV